MEVDKDNGDIKQVALLSSRPRTKKRSTLAKLKEKQQKELELGTSGKKDNFGSHTSLTKDKINLERESAQVITNDLKTTGKLYSTDKSHGEGFDSYKFSTKDPPDEQSKRPRPLPRGRRQSSDTSVEILNNKNSSFNDSEDDSLRRHDSLDGTPIQMLRNLKMDGDQTDVVEAAINQTSFVPKPPTTPRKPRSNPRTPRGYILTSKGEKRTREPWLSGDEPEVEEKKEKSNRIIDSLSSTDTAEAVDTFNSDNATEQISTNEFGNNIGEATSSSHQSRDNRVHKDRLRRRSINAKRDGESQENLHSIIYPNIDILPTPYNLSDADKHITSAKTKPKDSDTLTSHVSDYFIQESQVDVSSKSNILLRDSSPDGQPGPNIISSISKSGMDLEKTSHTLTNTNTNNGGSSKANMPDNASPVQVNHLLANTTSDSQPANGLQVSESTQEMYPVLSPRRMSRLDPINPKFHPPPLPEELSSRNLRTMYKIDPDVYQRTGIGQFGTGAKKSYSGSNSNGDHLSQRSYSSVSVLPVITTKEARSRHGCEGSFIGGLSSNFGTDELDRYFPERKVNIFVGTWNMNEIKDMTSSLDDFILPEKCNYVHDVYAIGTQENNMNKKEWEVKVQETLGLSHVMFHSVSLGSLHLAVFVRRDLIWFCSVPEDDVISLRAVTIVKTKGAVGICFTLFGTSYLFINCHLTADRSNETSRKKNRLEDYCKVISEMKLPKGSEVSNAEQKSRDVTAIFDCIFWFGDLNFRIERKRHVVQNKVDQIATEEFPNFETLLGADQLLNYMTEGRIFGGFQEGRINFNPTFKFDVHTDKYDTSTKNRVPSYTDRIMFRSKKKHDITCMQYDAVLNIKMSDHRPVYGLYETAIKPARDNVVFSVGHFDKSVYVEANRRRKTTPAVKKKQSVVCVIQ